MPISRLRDRNWAPRGRRYAAADAFVVSIPKSGRTWMRVFLRHHLCASAGTDFRLTGALEGCSALPDVEFTHDRWEHENAARWWDRIRGKYQVPAQARRRTPVVLAVRDLRDVMVSMHVHLRKRGFACGASFDGSLSELIRHPGLGVERCVDLLNGWYREWHQRGRLFIWRYEDCHRDPERVFADLLDFLGLPPPTPQALAASTAFASFDSMRALERSGRFWKSPVLRPGNPADPQSFKVRRGVVGGYVDHLSDEDLFRIERASSRLLLDGVPTGVVRVPRRHGTYRATTPATVS